MAQVNVLMVQGSGRSEILARVEVATCDLVKVLTIIDEIIKDYDLENRGGEK